MPPTRESSPSCTCSESRRSSASSTSAAPSSASSTKATTELNFKMTFNAFVSEASVHPLPAYARDFPKPTSEINIDEALSRKPGRWTFRGSIEANSKRQPRPSIDDQEKREARSADYAAAKKSLLEIAAQMDAAKPK
ncbi:hypothetical protein V2A60_005335 [Cordyceps javanica]|uniref:Uncharacterized protein n=1 Tax=Cordyceps javanica TaxID=43265 RepID=A0A545VDV7_9HYPO|nr:hypothetical protein IF1G_02130 [Cordyceps javanica]TQW10414.1 hypothetical protein IF2G_01356 [Cordyceps javanica]